MKLVMLLAALRPVALAVTCALSIGATSCSSADPEPTWRSRTGGSWPGADPNAEGAPPLAASTPNAASPNGTAPAPSTTPPSIAGAITLRSAVSGFVMLGDGTRFFSAIDGNAPVTFTDPSIVGPQDVTFVQVFTQSGTFSARTILGVTRADVELSGAFGPLTKHAALKGTVTPWAGAPSAPVHLEALVERPRYGYNSTELTTPGAFELEINGYGGAPAELDLLAMQHDGVLPSFGLVTVVLGSSSSTSVVDQQNLIVDHRADVPVDVKLKNAEQYANGTGGADELFVSLLQRRGDSVFYTTTAIASGGTVRLHDIPATGGFARYSPQVRVRTNNVSGSLGEVEIRQPRVSNVQEVVLPLPTEAPRLIAPANHLAASNETELTPQQKLTWSNTSAGDLVSLVIQSSSNAGPTQAASSWVVSGDGAKHDFQPFVFPAAVGTTRFFTRGNFYVSISKMRFENRTADALLGAPADDVERATSDGYRLHSTRTVLD